MKQERISRHHLFQDGSCCAPHRKEDSNSSTHMPQAANSYCLFFPQHSSNANKEYSWGARHHSSNTISLWSQSYPLSGINPASVSDNFPLFLFFWNRVSPYNSGCLGTHFIDLVGLKLQDLPASSSRVLGLKAYPTDTHMLKSF